MQETSLVPALASSSITPRELSGSRLYPQINTPEKAAVVISKARAWGLEPTCVAESLYFINGKPALTSNMHAVLVKRSGRYDYRVVEKTATKAVIVFREKVDGKWEQIGKETFSMDDAKAAGLNNKQPWKQFPAAMLFARCLTAGVRTHCPDVLVGTCVYSVEELQPDARYDDEGRPIPEVEVVDIEPEETEEEETEEEGISPASVPNELERLIALHGKDEQAALEYLGITSTDQATPEMIEKLKKTYELKSKLKGKAKKS